MSLGTTEGIIAALIIIVLNVYQDKTETKPLAVTNDPGESIVIFSKGSYFCPSYCKISHPHRAHSLDHNCGSDVCNHYVAEPQSEKTAVKKNSLE